MDDDDEGTLPLRDPGIGARREPRAAPRRFVSVGAAAAAMGLLLVGAVGGLYVQGPFVRAFFALTDLEPGAGSRHPIALPPAVTTGAEMGDVSDAVVALGRLQPRGGVVEVASPTTAGAPRVAEVLVAEGDVVEAGQPLVRLDTYAQLLAARVAAERAVAVAEAALTQVRRDVRAGRSESRAGVEAAQAAADHAEAERARLASLHAEGAVPDAQFDAAAATAAQAAAEVRRVQAVAGRFADPAEIAVAQEQLDAARADLARAEAELATSTVLATTAGTVLSLDVRAGERAPTGRLLSLGDLTRMEAELEVFQDAAPRVAIGQPVRASSSVLVDGPLTGTVQRVGPTVGRQTLTGNDPAANTDARVVTVLVALDEPSSARAARFVGLEVVAHIAVADDAAPGVAAP
jgi:HlyD family secretion protein